MPTFDGFDAPAGFAARTRTYAAGSQVLSADLNSIQDKAIDVSGGLDGIAVKIHRVENSSGTRLLAHLPDQYGGHTVWVVATMIDSTEVVIDADFDWRDRIVESSLSLVHPTTSGDVMPGEADDAELRSGVELATSWGHSNFYSELGQDGSAASPGLQADLDSSGSSEYVRLYARDTDGALCVFKDGAGQPEYHIIGRVSCSPRLNAVTL